MSESDDIEYHGISLAREVGEACDRFKPDSGTYPLS